MTITTQMAPPAADGALAFVYESGGNVVAPLEPEFESLADRWSDETAFMSSVSEITSHPDYLRIIALGRPVIPLLFRRLRDEPDFWFTALEALTGNQPVSADAVGDIEKMTSAWLIWGTQHGLLTD